MREKDNALSALGELSPPFVKITLIDVKGSAPRAQGCMMLITSQKFYGQETLYGTIGGGALEFQSIKRAQKILQEASSSSPYYRTIETIPLGPNLGQCCGGSVKILYELIDAQAHEDYQHHINSGTKQIAIALESGIALTAASEAKPHKSYVMTLHRPRKHLYLYGAGHVARALIYHLQKFDVTIHWADSDKTRFPDNIPDDIECLYNPDLSLIADYAQPDSYHLVMSHDHAFDLQVIDRLLARDDFYFLGLIGSQTKKMRFYKRLQEMGHDEAKISQIICPIGIENIKQKSPHTIAIAIIAQLLVS
ncbi:MAG: xanthine dehydrogenase accessory protein XdhC [Alphaproteobacteria bacterium]|nr:xanthine dehydrogenase accessory protein XdhC [Alphaproteobacteria bacterium]